MFSKFRISWSILLLAVVAALVIAAGCVSVRFGKSDDETAPIPEAGASAGIEGLPSEFDILAEVWAHLQEEHLRGRELDAELLSQGAARGIIEALDDPHAAYLTPEQQQQESQDLRGEFEGIGAHVGMRDGRITIIAPIADTPADKAGLKPGDILTSINGESAEGLSIMEAVGRIRGPKGEAVELGVFPPVQGRASNGDHRQGRNPGGKRELEDAGGADSPSPDNLLHRQHQPGGGRGHRNPAQARRQWNYIGPAEQPRRVSQDRRGRHQPVRRRRDSPLRGGRSRKEERLALEEGRACPGHSYGGAG